MRITKEYIYDIRTQNRYQVAYNESNEIIKINRKCYQNKLYFFDDYSDEYSQRDFMWITDDSRVIEIDDFLLNLMTNTELFMDKMRELATYEKITNYISFLKL